jgi:hypothetical protein
LTANTTSLWNFGFRSLFKEYGREFFKHIAFPHPFQTLKGVYKFNTQGMKGYNNFKEKAWPGGRESLVGLGFCLKPIDPPCPSGRANHECQYLEENLHIKEKPIPLPCQDCTIRKIGFAALCCSSSFYIMTSAKDILHDLLLPSIQNNLYSAALLGLCHYSFEPFKLALSICSLEASLFSFAEGDCKDFKTWDLADKGIKHDRTALKTEDIDAIVGILNNSPRAKPLDLQCTRSGHIFHSHD